jgi:hypothetical protein
MIKKKKVIRKNNMAKKAKNIISVINMKSIENMLKIGFILIEIIKLIT